MKYIEQGVDRDGVKCWFLLEDADLISIHYTEEEANNNI